jgi:hypothetical protein
MPVDFEQALAQYGIVGVFAKTNPEIKKILDQAVAGAWDSARFERALWNTQWWKKQAEAKRNLSVLKATDPAEYKLQLATKATAVASLAARMGVKINVEYWAQRALDNAWDEGTLRAIIFNNGRSPGFSGGGEAGEYESHLKETYGAYGVPVSQSRLNSDIHDILAGRQTIGGLDNMLREQAKKMYPQFTADFDAGKTLWDIADPYIQTMASTLEIGDAQINLNDPKIKTALQHTGPDGKHAPMQLWEFEQKLKADPRWDTTKQAANETYSVLEKIGQDWGFSA